MPSCPFPASWFRELEPLPWLGFPGPCTSAGIQARSRPCQAPPGPFLSPETQGRGFSRLRDPQHRSPRRTLANSFHMNGKHEFSSLFFSGKKYVLKKIKSNPICLWSQWSPVVWLSLELNAMPLGWPWTVHTPNLLQTWAHVGTDGRPCVFTETGSDGARVDSAHGAVAGPAPAGLAGRSLGRGRRCGGHLLGAQGLLCGLPGGAQISKPALLKSRKHQ